jgi:hypothetical protein
MQRRAQKNAIFAKALFLRGKELELRCTLQGRSAFRLNARGRENSKQKINMYALKQTLFEEKKTTLGKITPSAEQLQLGEESFFSAAAQLMVRVELENE